HLHRIGKVDSPLCPCCKREEETAEHFLLHCPAHRGARSRLRAGVGRRMMSMEGLLDNRDSFEALFSFINDTQRLHHIFGVL
ncbi:hypothetical protein EV360DRAFT_23340, partial [Lentinula raphanica]